MCQKYDFVLFIALNFKNLTYQVVEGAGDWIKSRLPFKICKVEKILKGSLDFIQSPSPSVKIEIIGGNVCLRCKGKTLLGVVNKLYTSSKLSGP
jgi:hypothetical protein